MKQQPLGLRDYLPDDIRRRDALIKKMSEVALDNNYDRIITPVIESYDALQPGLGTLADDCISFFDGGGSRLVLRPDHTTPIARIVGSRLTQDLPVRLFYHDPVFRNDPLLGETEIFQWGVEHIGHLTIQDEIAMIQMAVASCSAIGLDDIE
ncbi:MAG: ATP phosphoribosyltransferase regulatory subunit, partial [Candidatus Marinamargulisbacteria bacterium]